MQLKLQKRILLENYYYSAGYKIQNNEARDYLGIIREVCLINKYIYSV